MNKLYIAFLALLSPVLSYHRAIQLHPAAQEHTQNNIQSGNINFDNSRDNRRFNRQSSQFSDASNGFDWYSDANFDSNFNRRRFNGFNWNMGNDDQQDRLIFEDDFEDRNYLVKTTHRVPTTRRRPTTQRIPTSSTVAVPGMGTPRTPCEDRCLSTPEYNPVCGDDDMTYFSRHRLICAQHCGKRVKLKHLGACSRIPPRG